MAEGLSTSGIQELGTEVLSTEASISGGLESPLRGFRFTVNFEGLGTTSFRSCTGGFSITNSPNEYREGGFGRLSKRKLPGMVEYSEFTLEKGLYSNPLLYNWFDSFLEGNDFKPVNATIILYNNAGTPTASWSVINAWPSSYNSGDLNAEDSSILIESLTIQHEGIKRDVTVAAG